MKKIISIVLCLIIVFSLGALTVSASEATDVKACRDKADFADYFYDGYSVDYVRNFVCNFFVNEEDEIFDKETMTHPFNGDVVNQYLSENFVYSDKMFAEIQVALGYNKETNIYHLPFIGGFGGMIYTREYVSYVKNANNTYSLYYQKIDWLDLPQSEYDKLEAANEWPESVVYNGKTYENTADGYLCKNGYLDGGLVHTFDIKNGTARFISTEKYTGNKVPAAPKPSDKEENKENNKEDIKEDNKNNNTDKNTSETDKSTESEPVKPTQTVTQTEGLVLEAVENTFDKDTVVKAEKIEETAEAFEKVSAALKPVAKKFVAYEITAVKNNAKIQPDGTVTATFDIPEDFDTAKTVVFYVSEDGKTEELKTTVDADTRKATATLEHFSTYVVAEKTVEAEVENDKNDDNDNGKSISPWLIVAIVVFVLAAAALAVILVIKFKNK